MPVTRPILRARNVRPGLALNGPLAVLRLITPEPCGERTAAQFVHTFTQSFVDTGAGIGFSIESYWSDTTVCFLDVSLAAN